MQSNEILITLDKLKSYVRKAARFAALHRNNEVLSAGMREKLQIVEEFLDDYEFLKSELISLGERAANLEHRAATKLSKTLPKVSTTVLTD